MLVHVSAAEAMAQIEWAQDRGLPVMAETCPQYLIDAADKIQAPGWEAAKYICSPPPREAATMPSFCGPAWRAGASACSPPTIAPIASKDPTASAARAASPIFAMSHRACPAWRRACRCSIRRACFAGRLSAQQFVALTATNPARTYGLYPRKGSLAPGADADIALWDSSQAVTIRHADLHDDCDYTPYEGREVGAWPVMTLSRGETVWDRGRVLGAPGRGQFLKQAAHR